MQILLKVSVQQRELIQHLGQCSSFPHCRKGPLGSPGSLLSFLKNKIKLKHITIAKLLSIVSNMCSGYLSDQSKITNLESDIT